MNTTNVQSETVKLTRAGSRSPIIPAVSEAVRREICRTQVKLTSGNRRNMRERTSDLPPSYEEVCSMHRSSKEDICFHKLASSLPVEIQNLFDLRDQYHHTYFTKQKTWVEGEGTYQGEMDWKGRRAGHGRMVWRNGG